MAALGSPPLPVFALVVHCPGLLPCRFADQGKNLVEPCWRGLCRCFTMGRAGLLDQPGERDDTRSPKCRSLILQKDNPACILITGAIGGSGALSLPLAEACCAVCSNQSLIRHLVAQMKKIPMHEKIGSGTHIFW